MGDERTFTLLPLLKVHYIGYDTFEGFETQTAAPLPTGTGDLDYIRVDCDGLI